MKVFGSFATSIAWEITESLLEDEAPAHLVDPSTCSTITQFKASSSNMIGLAILGPKVLLGVLQKCII